MTQQLSLFQPERPARPEWLRRMPEAYYRATDEDVLQEALGLYQQHAHHYTRAGSILRHMAESHRLGGYWSATIHALQARGFLDEIYCYYGSDTPADKCREYRGYSVHHRLKKEAHRAENGTN